MLASSLLTLALAAVSANAHSILGQVIVDGKPQGVKTGIRMPKNNSPVLKVDSDAIECNANTKPASDIIAVKSGSEIGIEWHRNPGQAGSDVISKSHRGPIEVYLAKISDAKQANVSSLGWFKISEQGYDINSDTWATDDLIKNKGVYNFKIPECIAEGDYLMRGSIIALHNADKPAEGAQHYMECAQISVSGTTGAKSPDTVSFPGAYKSDDPGLTFNIYKGKKAYFIPGPEVFTCDGSGNENTTATSATETATTTDAEDADETGTSTDGYEDNQTTDTDNATATSTTAASAKTSGACRAKRGHSRRH